MIGPRHLAVQRAVTGTREKRWNKGGGEDGGGGGGGGERGRVGRDKQFQLRVGTVL